MCIRDSSFFNNTKNHVKVKILGGTNYFDNGYPSGGNYWSDYSCNDVYYGPNQDIPGSDGIGDTQYIISGDGNTDNYPLIEPPTWANKGWNLITVPYKNNYTAETFGQSLDGCTVVCMFNALSQMFQTHVVGVPWDDFSIEDGVGYYVYLTDDTVFTTTGPPISSASVNLSPGWNMIGWYHDYDTTAESLGENISGCTVLCMFDALTQMFKTHVVGIPHNNYQVTVGMGLFVYVTEESIWHGEG